MAGEGAGGSYPPGWYPDPCGRHAYRWHDGRAYTDHVADQDGGQAVLTLDPVDTRPAAPPSPVEADSPSTPRVVRWLVRSAVAVGLFIVLTLVAANAIHRNGFKAWPPILRSALRDELGTRDDYGDAPLDCLAEAYTGALTPGDVTSLAARDRGLEDEADRIEHEAGTADDARAVVRGAIDALSGSLPDEFRHQQSSLRAWLDEVCNVSTP